MSNAVKNSGDSVDTKFKAEDIEDAGTVNELLKKAKQLNIKSALATFTNDVDVPKRLIANLKLKIKQEIE